MSVINNLYLYDHVRELLAIGDTFCPLRNNAPMNAAPIKCHKGIDNSLIFRVLGPDRIPYDVSCGQQVYARIIDPDNNMVVLEQLCRLGPAKGVVTLELDAGDIADIAAGIYNMVMVRTQQFVSNIPDYYIEKPLYSDMDDNVAMQLEITNQALKSPLNSIIIRPQDWTQDMMMPTLGPAVACMYTGRIPGGRIQNHKESVHSFSTCTTNATGILEIWGSLEETPDPYLSSARWFKIYPSTMAHDIEFIGYTGTQAWTFAANFMWLKFRYIPSQQVLGPGILEKLIIRT